MNILFLSAIVLILMSDIKNYYIRKKVSVTFDSCFIHRINIKFLHQKKQNHLLIFTALRPRGLLPTQELESHPIVL